MNRLIITSILTLLPLSAEAQVYTLPSVTVTAEREALKEETFQAHQVITRKDMEKMGASNVPEALSMVLGLDMASGSQDSRTVALVRPDGTVVSNNRNGFNYRTVASQLGVPWTPFAFVTSRASSRCPKPML